MDIYHTNTVDYFCELLSFRSGTNYEVVKFNIGNPASWSMRCDFDVDIKLLLNVLSTD
ncbi:MAG: hypothetical protein ACI8P9_005162 [Parasphingorhabdus sp.]|jgi:hypothetical protein